MTSIKFERFERDCQRNKNIRNDGETAGIIYDWRVIIGGEHRATLYREPSGYEIRDPDHRPIQTAARAAQTWGGRHRGSTVDKRADFEQFVTDLLREDRIPTLVFLAQLRVAEAAAKVARDLQARQNIRDWRAQKQGPALLKALKALDEAINATLVGLPGPQNPLRAALALSRAAIDEAQDMGEHFELTLEQEIRKLEGDAK